MWYFITRVLCPFLLSFVVAALGTALLRNLARKAGLLDRPGQHKQHESPTPTLGGLAVFLAFVVGVLVSGPLSSRLLSILQASAVIVGVGLLDDLKGVNANIKLAALGVCSWMLWRDGIYLSLWGLQGWQALVVTFLWLGLVSSAFNGVDNADGAAAGLASISAGWAFLISWYSWQHDLAVVSIILAGSCLGFLVFNFPWPRATIFLGDSGSLFIGFGLATLTILGQWSNSPWRAAVVAPMLVLVPLFDFLFILIVRGLEGRYKAWDDPIRMCARDHLFHRLRLLGLNGKLSVLSLYSLAMLGGWIAYRSSLDEHYLKPVLALQLLAFLLVLGTAMRRIQPPPEAYPEAVA